MAKAQGKVWLVTGSTSGFGRSIVEAVLERGECAIVTGRKVDAIADLAQRYPETALVTTLDVTDAQSVGRAVEQGLNRFGRIDVLVNNAGYGMVGALEETTDEDWRALFDVNVFGLVDVTKAVLPAMRAQRSGTIVNISSVGGFVAIVGSATYASSKFAVEAISEATALDLKPLGINVLIVEPSAFRTGFAGDAMKVAEPVDDYAETVGKRRERIGDMDGNQPGDPERAAHAIIEAVEADDPPLRLALGNAAVDSIRRKLATMSRELDTWEDVSRAADFPKVE